MASSEPPDNAVLLLDNLRDMFRSQIEPDVVQMILVDCGYNVNATIETLLNLVAQQRVDHRKHDSDLNSFETVQSETEEKSANTQSNHINGVEYQTLHTISDTGRDSIYKSNEDLYFEEEELSEVLGSKGTIRNEFAIGSNQSNGFKIRSRTVLSPDSDRSIEGDASESIDTMASSKQQSGGSGGGTPVQSLKIQSKKKKYVPGVKQPESNFVPIPGVKRPQSNFVPIPGVKRPQSNFVPIPGVKRPQSNFVPIPGAANLTAEQTKLVQTLIQSFGQQQMKAMPPSLMTQLIPKMKPQNEVHSHKTAQKTEHTKPTNGSDVTATTSLQHRRDEESGVIARINAGQRVLILLRGCPGSGKSTLARKLKYNGVVLSADSFFEHNGVYEFDPALIGEAHFETRKRALEHMQNNVSPIIVDNTNLESWEMEPYVLMAIKLRYFIALLEPQTPWRYNPFHLAKRNSHGIPFYKIQSMLAKFDHDVTVPTLLRRIGPRIDMHKQKMGLKEQNQLYESLGELSRRMSLTETTTTAANVAATTEQSPVKQQKKNKVKKVQQENAQRNEPAADGQSSGAHQGTTESEGGQPEIQKSNKKTKKKKTLSKSCSVPNIAEMSKESSTSSMHQFNIVSVDGNNGAEKSQLDSDEEPFLDEGTATLSENMKDLMLIDFGFVPPHNRDPFGDDIVSTDGSLSESLLSPVKRGRLAASFGHLASSTNWDLPPYPGANELSDEAVVASNRNRSNSSGGDFARFDVACSPSTSATSSEFDDAKKAEATANLKTYFPSVPMEDLCDLIDKCEGNVQWVANLLLDEGHEYNMEVDSGKDLTLERSIEGMADLDGSDNGEEDNKTLRASTEAVSVVPSPGCVTPVEQPEELVLRIDPVFAMQLEKLFGPVAFSVSSGSYCGNDLNVAIDLDTARDIHGFWSQSLMKKFEREESTLNEMIKDESYAIQIQQVEDARIAANLEASERDPDFPPLTAESLLLGLNQQKLPTNTEGLASKIKRQQLYEMFPKIDRKAVDEVFNANGGSFLETVQSIETTFCPNEKPRLVIAPELISEYENAWLKIAQQESQILYEKEKEKDRVVAQQAVIDPSYDDLRAEATVHYHRRQDCFARAQDAYRQNMKAVASFYSQQGHLHSQKLHEANRRAMEVILAKQNAGKKSNTLDLHMLFVHEAMEALTTFIRRKKVELEASTELGLTVYIVTGKGMHSNHGLPRIKPAVMDFLKSRHYSAYEINPGVIEVKITKGSFVLPTKSTAQ